jgi:alpha-amylase
MKALGLALLVGCGATEIVATDDWRDEVIYQIVVDRFDDADPSNDGGVVIGDLARHQGGDWAGVTRRLGYLERLGATALWISPVVENVDRVEHQDGYHAYWGTDFTAPNRRFGTLEDLQTLVNEAHARGIKVIVDVVTNHTGRVFAYDMDRDGELDAGEDGPPWSDAPLDVPLLWTHDARLENLDLRAEHFHRRGQTTIYDQEQRELGDFPTGLRDLDTENEEVIAALVDTHVRWVELTGVDGFRIDAVPHVSRTFWARFCTDLRARLAAIGKERFLLLGEVFNPDPEVLASYVTQGQFDSVFDFSLKWEAIDAVLLDGAPASTVRGPLQDYRSFYSNEAQAGGVELTPWQARVSFADNHDMWRIAAEIDDQRVGMLALAIVFTVDAIPAVYYGTEQRFVGTGGDSSRERLWISGFREDTFEYEFIAHLSELRKSLPALRYGDLSVRWASETDGLFAYERTWQGETVLVAINGNASQPAFAEIPTSFAKGSKLTELLFAGDEEYEVEAQGNLPIQLPPRSAVMLIDR